MIQNGWIAKQGVVVDEILTYCMNHPFLNMKPPKSTGREQFGEAFVTELLNQFKKHSKRKYIGNCHDVYSMFNCSSL